MAPARTASQSHKSNHSQLPELQPNSFLACQVQATNAWRRDLRSLLSHASDRFADVCWTFREQDGDDENEGGDRTLGDSTFSAAMHRARTPPSSIGSHGGIVEEAPTIWAHKAILYARASNNFQARYLQLRTPADNLGAIASSSTISLPNVRSSSPGTSTLSRTPSTTSSRRSTQAKRKTFRGPAPPSSFRGGANKTPSIAAASDTEDEDDRSSASMRRMQSNSSIESFTIGRPLSRSAYTHTVNGSLAPPGMTDDDAFSVISGTSTLRAPMNLSDVSPAFFEATLEYLYTAEESVVEVFEFLFEDRVGPQDAVEKRLDKLRQDLVFMWRSRLYSDIEIVLGEDHVRTIPDAHASVLSLHIDESTEEEEVASFSAHRMMLASRSPYFASLLLSPYADTHNRVVSLPSPPFTPAAMHFTLGFIYTGTLFFSNRTFDLSTAFQLWLAGSYLQIETLQTLVSSLIIQDFCHAFSCSPPCKTCIKRVPRTLAFVSRPDVSDAHLHSLAQGAIIGEHFGTYWSKEIGNLDYVVRGSIVSDLCAKIDRAPGFIIPTLRQLAIVGARIDVERSTKWVESLRWMCEAVQGHISTIMSEAFKDIVKSKEWKNLIHGIGFLNDVLETSLTVLLDNLEETSAARNYEVLVGEVLLNEENPPSSDIVVLVEEARNAILQYVRKRWVNIRSMGGFNDLKRWALKEVADEINVPADDLLLLETNPLHHARKSSKTVTGRSSSPMTGEAGQWQAKQTKMPAPGTIVDGEREAGPIHLRAAVLNRNAARLSATQGSPQATNSDPVRPSRPTNQQAQSIAPSSRSTSVSTKHSVRSARVSESSSSRVSQIANRMSQDSATRQQASSPMTEKSVNKQSTLPVSRQKTDSNPTPSTSRVVSENVKRQNDSARNERSRTTSMQSTRSSIASTSKSNQPSNKSVSTIRSRVPSNASVISTKTVESRSGISTTNIPQRTNRALETKSNTGSLVRSRIASLNRTEPTKPVQTKAQRTTPVPALAKAQEDTIMTDLHPSKSQILHAEMFGTKLSMGIPCVIAPLTRNGKSSRFRATVKYIGPVQRKGGESGPMIGVEVNLPLPTGIDENLFDFHDGIYQGKEYFKIGSPDYSLVQSELHHKPEREARNRRIEEMLRAIQHLNDGTKGLLSSDVSNSIEGDSTVMPLTSSPDLANRDSSLPSAKRRKDLSGTGLSTAGKESSQIQSKGLFIRPNEVLWVVI